MIALFGGTFNPVHLGHIALAREVASAFNLDHVEFLPSYHSVHRDQPELSPELRQQMLRLAINPFSELSLNSSEIERRGPSFAVDTLRAIKQQFPQRTVCWLMGVDAFNGFMSWKEPAEILQLAHLIVCSRPGNQIDKSIFPQHHLAQTESFDQFPAGKIVFYTMNPNPCSSTKIRQQFKSPDSRFNASVSECLPGAVLEFIQQQQLYE